MCNKITDRLTVTQLGTNASHQVRTGGGWSCWQGRPWVWPTVCSPWSGSGTQGCVSSQDPAQSFWTCPDSPAAYGTLGIVFNAKWWPVMVSVAAALRRWPVLGAVDWSGPAPCSEEHTSPGFAVLLALEPVGPALGRLLRASVPPTLPLDPRQQIQWANVAWAAATRTSLALLRCFVF